MCKNIWFSSVILLVVGVCNLQAEQTITDNFNDNILDTAIWEAWNPHYPSRYVIEANGQLEFRSDGMEFPDEDTSGWTTTKLVLSISQNFRVQVHFNASECTDNSGIGLFVNNAYTDVNGQLDECFYIANGNTDPAPTGVREYIACKMTDFNSPPPVTEITSVSSGNFFVTNIGGTFYLSHIGHGEENAFATFTTEGWTNCTEVLVGIGGWSGYQILSGTGSHLDDFFLTTSTEPTCKHKPTMDFNNDCKVDFEDFAIFANSWLECNLDPPSACWE